ncbi:MAG: hypothetical protein KBA08_05935 [Firmicutes bacterium]|nr:hypothetical protein [Bacillota bacterium]
MEEEGTAWPLEIKAARPIYMAHSGHAGECRGTAPGYSSGVCKEAPPTRSFLPAVRLHFMVAQRTPAQG